MKMAKADDRDLRAANAVAGILEDIGKGYYPRRIAETPAGIEPVEWGNDNDDPTFFDSDDAEHCKAVVERLLLCENSGSLFRVTFGMQVLLDPANQIVDPDADTLEVHPRFKVAMEEREAFKASSDIRGAEVERRSIRVQELHRALLLTTAALRVVKEGRPVQLDMLGAALASAEALLSTEDASS
jgi:hypothetical protein